MVVAGDLDSSKLSTADCLSLFILQNSMAGPAREGLQLSNSRGQHLLLHKFSPRHQHLCAIFIDYIKELDWSIEVTVNQGSTVVLKNSKVL